MIDSGCLENLNRFEVGKMIGYNDLKAKRRILDKSIG